MNRTTTHPEKPVRQYSKLCINKIKQGAELLNSTPFIITHPIPVFPVSTFLMFTKEIAFLCIKSQKNNIFSFFLFLF